MTTTLQDNGIHEYFEDSEVLALRNHGQQHWTGLMKEGGGFRVVAENFKTVKGAIGEARRARKRIISARAKISN